MSTPQNFRSALNGFNREDVVNYISYMSNKHETQANALRAEAEELRQALEAREQVTLGLQSRVEELEQQNTCQAASEEMLQKVEELELEVAIRDEQIRNLEQTVAEQKEMLTSMKLELTAAQAARMERAVTEELNAYRRAESAERRAMERVNQMYDRANGALAEAAARARQNAEQIGIRAAAVAAELELLNQTVAAAGEIMTDAGDMLSGLRPELDK